MTSLPAFIMTSEFGSFARRTIEERKPIIIDQILSHFDYTPSIRTALLQFKDELEGGFVTPLTEQTSDRELWDVDLQPWAGRSWLDIPWLFAETFFYRKILEIVTYFQSGPWMGLDPYRQIKEDEYAIHYLFSLNLINLNLTKVPLRTSTRIVRMHYGGIGET